MGWDCRAKRAAESAYARATSVYKAAKLKYDNAKELMTSLNAESASVLRMIGKYNKANNVVREAGSTFCTTTNMGFLNTGVNCLIDYQSEVKEAQAKCRTELDTCKTNMDNAKIAMDNAKTTMENTPCVWVDDSKK